MTKDEALKLALKAFEWNYNTDLDNIPACEKWAKMLKENIAAIKEALAQPWEKFCDSNCVWTDHHPDCKLAEQEPVAWRAWVSKFPQGTGSDWVYVTKPIMKDRIHNQPLYTTPPQRTWVGLTEKDILEAAVKSQEGISPRNDTLRFAVAIEAKLKEKNNG